ncbi:hypothetical protein [Methylobacter sp. S3L5C]|uniref:hypothetical protein n=1 Tax=Methylobacter sp. S3L5C TaxID=2839024 RepID=UPI001FAE36A6|nr:hypothetical protein [Methylobacter sp. S3L5C]UOA10534.1 hypothetical protein KKZ03_10065 [Methylobacter sp. S3L5C]
MKKNLILGAAISAALLAGNAQAITVDANNFPVYDTSAAGDTRVVYMSGASAAGTFIEKVLTGAGVAADQICDVSQPIWKFKDNIDGATQKAYLCTQSTTATGLTLATGKANLLIYKRDEGGSGYGVSPIIAEANGDTAGATIEFLKVNSTNCTGVAPAAAGTLTSITCAYTTGTAGNNQLVVPDVGVSDVDPAQFQGLNAPLKTNNVTLFANVTAADVAKLTVTPGAAVVFGVPVSMHLYRALQGAQLAMHTIPVADPVSGTTCIVGDVTNAACMPSLSKQEIASLIKGDWNNWNKLMVTIPGVTAPLGLAAWASANQAADAPANATTHVCRRENGSGTQAQLNNFALNYPCTTASSTTPPAVGNDGLNGNTGTKTESSLVTLIHENSTSGRVTACLKDLNLGVDTAGDGFTNPYITGTAPKTFRWAIGAQALEKKDANFEFVRINGVAPTLVNVVKGDYLDWFENTFQYNTAHARFSEAGLKTTIDAIIKASTVPAVMGSINSGSGLSHGFGNGAYLANPKANTPVTTGIFNASLPVNPYSHTPSSAVALDNCRAPVTYNKSVAGL